MAGGQRPWQGPGPYGNGMPPPQQMPGYPPQYGVPPQGPGGHPQHPGPYPGPYPYPYMTQPRRRGGFGCLMNIVPFFWMLRLALWVVRRTGDVAKRLFVRDQHVRIVDRTVERVQLGRSVLGALATVALAYAYGTGGSYHDVVGDGFDTLIYTPVLLLVTGPLVVLGFLFYAPPDQRRQLRSRIREPLKTVGWYVLLIGGMIALIVWTATSDLIAGTSGSPALTAIAALFVLAIFFFGLPFMVRASYFVAKNAFNTALIHPVLPAVLTAVLVWVVAVFNLATDGMPGGPMAAQLCSVFGGPLTVTGISLWEMHRLRTRHGIVVRG